MTYTITITEPCAEPVSVSLEWTTDAPKVDGLYFVECQYRKANKFVVFGDRHSVVPFREGVHALRWLGPIPLAPE